MNEAQSRLTVRSITRRLAEAGLQVQVWRKATRERVHETWLKGSVVVLPVRGVLPDTDGWSVTWLDHEQTAMQNCVEQAWALLKWNPCGIAIICS